jgi:hypothetical protein
MVKKRKRGKIDFADHGPVEKRQHGTYVEMETTVAGVKALRNVTIDPVETYKSRGTITPNQYIAADTFAGQWRQANLAVIFAQVKYDQQPAGEAPLEYLEAVQQARQRVKAATAFVGYPLAYIIEHVCGYGLTAGTWRGVIESRRPHQDGMVALRLALDGLMRFYKIM